MTMVRWSPFSELSTLQERMNRLFEGRAGHSDEDSFGAWVPAVDIFDEGENLRLQAELPGLVEKETRDPIENESDNGLDNERGTIAMARTNDPDSATSQFYINLVDNPTLDYSPGQPGYTVFGRVIAGMDVVDAIGAVVVESREGFQNLPVQDVLIRNIIRLSPDSSGSSEIGGG